MFGRRWRLALQIGVAITGLAVGACGDDSAPSATTPAVSTGVAPTAATPGPTGASLDMASADFLLTVVPPDPRDFRTGISSVAIGDFNDDGVGDLLIGLPFGDGPSASREDAGEAFVIFGKRGLSGQIDLANDEPGLTIWGALAGDNLGFGVAAGDLNGDGVDDVIVGAPASNGLANERTDMGEAYVIFGRPDLAGAVDTLNEEQGFTLMAAEGFARLGTSFAVGDVNGDHVDDLIAGAPFAGREAGSPPGGPRTTVGEAYVVFGQRDLRGTVSVAKDQQDFTMAGAVAQDAFGQAVAVGDVNRDGIADIIVGARGYDGPDGNRDDAGAVFVYLGSSSLADKSGVTDASLTILGVDAGDGLGETLASGDVNGDQIDDIVGVARSGGGPDNRRSESGEAEVVFGSHGLLGVRDLASGSADAVVYGPEPGALLGTSVVVKDLDGDGGADILLGAPLTNGKGRFLSGVTYVVFGKGLAATTDLATGDGDTLAIYGAAENDVLGTGAAAGDISGDARPELILMAAADQGLGQGRGKIYAIDLP